MFFYVLNNGSIPRLFQPSNKTSFQVKHLSFDSIPEDPWDESGIKNRSMNVVDFYGKVHSLKLSFSL